VDRRELPEVNPPDNPGSSSRLKKMRGGNHVPCCTLFSMVIPMWSGVNDLFIPEIGHREIMADFIRAYSAPPGNKGVRINRGPGIDIFHREGVIPVPVFHDILPGFGNPWHRSARTKGD